MTCDFWAENAEKLMQQDEQQQNKGDKSVASPYGLRFCVIAQRAKALVGDPVLRQSGGALRRGFLRYARTRALSDWGDLREV